MAPLDPFAGDRRVVVGVSGGADSMALAWLLSRWGRPLACIVDHGLRPESGAEAALTASRLGRLGIPARVLGACVPPGPGLAARARQQRYALLLDACEQAGCGDLLVAHHARDQAETVRMRQGVGSGAAGLAGMAAVSYLRQARLLRPLLSVPPDRLRQTLAAAGVAWVEDPSNADRRTLRARLRAEMDSNQVEACLHTSKMLGTERRLAEAGVAEELAGVAFHPEGYAIASAGLSAPALSSLVWCLSGQKYPPPPRAVNAGLQPRTLHGVVIQPAGRLGPGWLLTREAAAAAAAAPATAGVRWDGRFSLASSAAGAMIGALGNDAARLRRWSHLPSVILRGLPAIRVGGDLAAVPHLAFPDPAICLTFPIRFDPAHPAAGASFVPG